MIQRSQLEKLDNWRFVIPKGTCHSMRTDALIYASEALIAESTCLRDSPRSLGPVPIGK